MEHQECSERTVTLPQRVAETMLAHARDASPAECCGLLLGRQHAIVEAVPARNVAVDPRRRFLIDAKDHFDVVRAARRRALDVVGVYHSHPSSTARPSPTDAAEGFADFVFLIVGLGMEPPEIAAWTWADGNFTELALVRHV
jgi:proteasome lid subunit RPN8/RPN11